MRRALVALVAMCCACGARHHTPSVAQGGAKTESKLPEGPPLVTPGERMSYRMVLGDVELGVYDIAVGDIADVAGKRAIVVQSHARATGLAKVVTNVDEMFTSWLDVSSGRPLLWVVDEKLKKGDIERTEVRIHEREGNVVPAEYKINDGAPTVEPQTVSAPDIWDNNAFLVVLRAWEAPVGSTITTEVLRGRYLWRVTMTVRGKETLVTDLGELPALRFDGQSYKLKRDGTRAPNNEDRQFSIWISDDGDRVPLQNTAQTDYGDIKMTIVDYQPGNGQRLRTTSAEASSGTARRP